LKKVIAIFVLTVILLTACSASESATPSQPVVDTAPTTLTNLDLFYGFLEQNNANIKQSISNTCSNKFAWVKGVEIVGQATIVDSNPSTVTYVVAPMIKTDNYLVALEGPKLGVYNTDGDTVVGQEFVIPAMQDAANVSGGKTNLTVTFKLTEAEGGTITPSEFECK
jgi:hypothetical protein